MKAKLFIISLIIMATGLLVSCERPTEKELKNYLTVLSAYYPYSANEKFVFENESTGRTWEADAYDYYNDGIYPYTHISICNDVFSKCGRDRSATIAAWMLEKGADSRNRVSDISTGIYYTGGENKEGMIYWYVSLSLSDSVRYIGDARSICHIDDIYSKLTDVVTIPLHPEPLYPNMTIPSIEGAYACIVKGKGLTEFSIDGTTTYIRKTE